jgi:homoserine dehydrogenase
LFEWDPKRSGSPRQFQEITFDNALQLDETIVQHKAIRFAQQRGRPFEVGSLRSAPSTRVGDYSKNRFYDDGRCPQPLRVGLLGLGTVGLGFYQHLGKFSSVKVTQIAVRDIQKAINHGVPQTTVTNNAVSVIQQDCDVVVELLGGIEPALTLVRAALESGKHVITANKSLIARHGDELRQIADEKQVQVLYSGSVGGGVPMIETVRRISSAREIVEIEGVLSGTCNFVLDKVAHDVSFTEAVLAAQRAGFAEGDPTLDLNGTDAGEKLTILARNAGFDLDFADIKRQAIDQELIKRWQAKVQKNEVLRQVSSISISGARESGWNIKAQVEIKALPINHFYASVCGEDNLLILKTACGRRIQLVGRGAGRHPTSQAVVNDLLQLLTKVSALTARTGSESKQTISA